MPYKGLADGTIVNTLTMADSDWAAIHVPARRRAVEIRCAVAACAVPMYPKERNFPAPVGVVRYFCHWPGAAGEGRCGGESVGHLALKAVLARSSAGAGWTVDVEVSFDGGRVDVLATRDGHAHVWEAQLSPLGVDTAVARHAAYTALGEPTWVHVGSVPWRRAVPSLELGEVDDEMNAFTVVDGVYALDGTDGVGRLGPQPLDLAVPRVLDGRYDYLPTERRDGDGVYGIYWDRLAGTSEETARSRLGRRGDQGCDHQSR
jgi:competence protein CoiA